MDVGCGQPPPNPHPCPPHAWITVKMPAASCTVADFELRIRQRPTVQLLAIYFKDGSDCGLGTYIVKGDRVTLKTFKFNSWELLQGKPIRLLNPAPVLEVLRP